MTDTEFEELYQIVLNNRKELINKKPDVAKTFKKWRLKHDATYFAIDFPERSRSLNKKVYTVLLSGKSDDEILAELNKIIPPNFRPY